MESGEQVEEIVRRQMRGFTRELNRQAKLEEAQALRRGHTTQLLRGFAIEGRFRVYEDAQQSRLVALVQGIQSKLHAVCQKLFKLRFNRISDAPQASYRF